MHATPAIRGPLSIGDLLDRTFLVLRARFGLLALTTAVILAPIGVLMGLFTGRFLVGYMGIFQAMALAGEEPDPEMMGEMIGTLAGYMGVLLLLAALNLLATTLAELAVTYQVHHFLHSGALTLAQGVREALRRFVPAIGLLLLKWLAIGAATMVTLMVVGIAFAAIALLVGGLGTLAGSETTAGTVVMIGLVVILVAGYLVALALAFLPAAYLITRWVAGLPSLALELLGPRAALRRSWQLTRGRVLRTFGVVALLMLLNFLVISLPLALFQQLMLLFFPAESGLAFTFSTGASYLINMLWQPLYATGMVVLYYDLRVRAESYDLSLQLQQLEHEQEHGNR
jgi:hypothetical protein